MNERQKSDIRDNLIVKPEEEKMSIGFRHGVLVETYEDQARKQGYTLGKMARSIERVGKGLLLANIYGVMTDREFTKILKKFQKKMLVRNLKPIKEE